jgi:hypothetical protein
MRHNRDIIVALDAFRGSWRLAFSHRLTNASGLLLFPLQVAPENSQAEKISKFPRDRESQMY